MKDIAKLAGVSQKTVSRVVNSSAEVSSATRISVNKAILQLGYRPNTFARSLVSRRSSMIGIIPVGSSSYTTYANIVATERAARAVGYSTILGTASNDISGAIDQLLDRQVDGIIVLEPVDNSTWDPRPLHGTPVVSIGSMLGATDRTMVGYDQASAAQLATDHLLDLGHATVWHIAGPSDSPIAAARVHGWRTALHQVNASMPPPIIAEDWSARAGFVAGQVVAANSAMTAVFVASDYMAMGVMRAIVDYGRRIPEDVSVVGFDDVPEAEYQIVPLTTIREDHEILAKRSVNELVAIINGSPVPSQDIELPLELIVRQSTGPAPNTT